MKFIMLLSLLCSSWGFAHSIQDTQLFLQEKKPAVQSWKALRDKGIVKQDLDYSCGAASIATLLNQQYGQEVTEAQVLDLMIELGQEEGMASFADMQAVLPHLGFRGEGYALSFEQLRALRAPVIVYLSYRSNDHFSVLRGIDGETVLLADPSLGHVSLQREQFLKAWHTRDSALAGKILAIVPADALARSDSDFFTRTPLRQSDTAMQIVRMLMRY